MRKRCLLNTNDHQQLAKLIKICLIMLLQYSWNTKHQLRCFRVEISMCFFLWLLLFHPKWTSFNDSVIICEYRHCLYSTVSIGHFMGVAIAHLKLEIHFYTKIHMLQLNTVANFFIDWLRAIDFGDQCLVKSFFGKMLTIEWAV